MVTQGSFCLAASDKRIAVSVMTHFPSSPGVDSLSASSVRICKEVFEEDFQPSKEGKYN